jgi:predicted CopG family antitoxin
MNKSPILRKTHNIAVDDNNYQALKSLGRVGDSFNDAVTQLIKIVMEKGGATA